MAKSMIEQEKEQQRLREQKKQLEQRAALMAQMMAGSQTQAQPAYAPVVEEAQTKRGRKKSRAATIAERRPMQKSIHFTSEDTLNMEQIKFNLLKAGVDKADANAENIVYFFFQHCIDKFGTEIPIEQFKKILL